MRWITFASLYPNRAFPIRGVFVRERLRAVLRQRGGQAMVVAPAPWFPWRRGFGSWSRWATVPARELDDGLRVFHPRYPYIPKLGILVHPLLVQLGVERLVRRLAPQAALIDAHFLYPDGVAAVRLGRQLNLPVVLTARGSDVNLLLQWAAPRAWIRAALWQAAAVTTVSEDLRRRLASATGFPAEQIEVIPNGVDRSRFSPADQDAARKRLGLPAAGRILLTVGNLVPGKRFDLLLGALALLEPARRPLLVCVGEGPDRAALEQRARADGLAAQVRFVGAQPHTSLPDWYRAADVVALATDREGLPNVLLEAIGCGRPVIASRVGGVPELVDDEVGIVVEDNSPAAFAQALETLARRSLAPAAFERRAQAFSSELVGQRVGALFERVAERGPARSLGAP
jgi:teichuronic acid biosynthesis glycosyltransferase TuaC